MNGYGYMYMYKCMSNAKQFIDLHVSIALSLDVIVSERDHTGWSPREWSVDTGLGWTNKDIIWKTPLLELGVGPKTISK